MAEEDGKVEEGIQEDKVEIEDEEQAGKKIYKEVITISEPENPANVTELESGLSSPSNPFEVEEMEVEALSPSSTSLRELVSEPKSTDPFSSFQTESRLSDDEKKVLIRSHPIQPGSTPEGQRIKLPFDKNRFYHKKESGCERRMWVSYNYVRKRLFCWMCRAFGTSSTSAFVAGGWGNDALWSKGSCYKAIDLHECSRDHAKAVSALMAFADDQSVKDRMASNATVLRKKQVTERREVVLRIINIVLFIGRQGLAFRGSQDEAACSL